MFSAVRSLFENTPNLEPGMVDTVLTTTCDNSNYLSSIVSEVSGIQPKISHSVESLCNSGTNCIISAFSYIASGLADVALVVGAENFDSPGRVLEWDRSRGQFRHPIYWSTLFTKSHMRKYGTTKEELAIVSAKNHRLAIDNPFSFFSRSYSVDEIMSSRNLTDNIRLLECSMPCSGSAAIILASCETAKKITKTPIKIVGIGQKTLSASFTKQKDLTTMESTRFAAHDAFQMAGKKPSQINVAELHDAFSICEIMETEDLGFAPKGKGGEFVKILYETDDRRINSRGGLIGSGHPLAATGIAQTIEVFQQLQGIAGKRQINDARIGLVQNMSAAATSSSVLILQS